MSTPVIILALVSMVITLSVSLRDHAGLAAAVDLAELRAEHAADAFIASCVTHEGCAPPGAEGIEACAAADAGVVMTARVSWSPMLWKHLTPATAERVVAYDEGLDARFRARAAAAVDAC